MKPQRAKQLQLVLNEWGHHKTYGDQEINSSFLEDLKSEGFALEEMIESGLLKVVVSADMDSHQAFGDANCELLSANAIGVGRETDAVVITLRGGELMQESLSLLQSSILNEAMLLDMGRLATLAGTAHAAGSQSKKIRTR